MELALDTPAKFIPLVGPVRAEALARLGIYTVQDFLYHIPFRYNDYSLVTPIRNARPGETVTIKGTVQSMKTFVTKNGKRIIEGTVADETGTMKLTWFNQQYLLNVIGEGDIVSFSGPVSWFGKKIVIGNPQFEVISAKGESLHTGRLVPVYPETENISSKWLRGRIHFLLEQLTPQLIEHLPKTTITTHHLFDLPHALHAIHFPESTPDAENARRRLGFEELLILHLRAKFLRLEWEKTQSGRPLKLKKADLLAFIKAIPFTLTPDQQTVIKEIEENLTGTLPMNRLLIGDVGSGKTIVAAFAMYMAFKAGLSSLLMAPTQILAEQHYRSLSALLKPLGIEVDLITGSVSTLDGKKKKVVVGTHALLTNQDNVGDVGVVVIDEQHRFGVKQRGKLLEKHEDGTSPHLLTMTATPIPRTIARTFFGNLDVSFLLQMPKGRQRVKTWLVPNEKRKSGYEWMKKEIKENGGQIFIVCPFIEPSETMTTVKAVTEEYAGLQKIFHGYSVGLLHGRMKPNEKTEVLEAFRDKKHHILLATPVVEVGIDIPNATVIVIEAADRFGLGQLHQLRGRVGRGEKQSYCLLFTENTEEGSLARLKAMETIYSGPELAELDLKLRGAGDVFGIRQHGMPILKIARLTDMPLLEETKNAAEAILTTDPELIHLPYLRETVKTDILSGISD